ncbi:LysR family transcriptional regulator [Nitratifractor sp.]|uniref:LysR family transcriptional regulator n=1 Tax=Nitratifractor sp. TaxID=2268144 RepID=UPI0025FE46C2|nr:LysR family transcriptional regulator [Nitratifractor sp.]
MKLTLRQIEIFLNVVEQGHLTNVAKSMGLSQSAVSMSIKELENIIGRPLFDRLNKKLILNEVGRNFHQAVEPLYRKLEDIEYEFQNTEDKGTVRVGASTTIVDYLIPPIACRYMGEYPDVRVQLKEGNTLQIAEMVKQGELDMGFVEGEVEDPDLIKEVIGDDELIVVTANKEIAGRSWYIDELADQRWVLREEGSGTRAVFLDYIKEKVPRLNIFMELGHTESIKSLMKSGKALTCISALAVSEELEEGILHKVNLKNFDCRRHFYAIYHKDKYRSDLFYKFLEFSKTLIGESMECRGCGKD